MGTCASKPAVRDDAVSTGEAKEVIFWSLCLYVEIVHVIVAVRLSFESSLRRQNTVRGQHDFTPRKRKPRPDYLASDVKVGTRSRPSDSHCLS